MSVFDTLLDAEISAAIGDAEHRSQHVGPSDLPLYDVLRYHLGFRDRLFRPERVATGKRIRPRLCLLACAACGGHAESAIHAAAAIELLHNFTLIHDDVQDDSLLRRNRETVWSLWGVPQAINAGDAMFAVAHLALNRSLLAGIDPAVVLELSTTLHQTTLRIVEGQVLDLGFEQRDDVTANEYLEMIAGKTAALSRAACWSGATIAGADTRTRDLIAEFGYALGIGFQMQDDLLGVWGDPAETGKAAADDIRRRKKSYPVLLLHDRLSPGDREQVAAVYTDAEVSTDGIATVLDLMDRYGIRSATQEQVQHWHDRAAALLGKAVPDSSALDELTTLVASLSVRSG